MVTIDEQKEYLLNFMSDACEIELSKTTDMIFLSIFKKELRKTFPLSETQRIITKVDINLSGLGDAEPHMEFLTKMAESYAKFMRKIKDELEPEFGIDFVIEMAKKISLTLE